MEVNFSLPENQFVTESPEKVTAKVRLYAALGLYKAGELSIGAACELADVDRYTFLDFCKREGVPIQTQTLDELETEFEQLNREG